MRPGSNESDQNLLMGLMALQLAMITPEEFVEALAASVPGSQAPLTDHLEAREILTLSQCQMLEGLVREILRHSGGDPSSSLALFGGRERISHILRGSSRREDASMLASEMGIPLDAEAFNTAALDAPTEEPGRYTRTREHSRGGMGRILLVHDEHLMRDVALKELLPKAPGVTETGSTGGKEDQTSLHPPAEVVARFLREAQITGQLAHPSIVPVYELGKREDGTLYYTMKLVRGRPLSVAIAESKTLSDRLAFLAQFTDVCQAIAYAHSRNIIHRDLKPSNIMLGEFGEAVVIDWGLAKVLGNDESTERALDPSIINDAEEKADEELLGTRTGARLGTPYYMSPEQARGEIRALDRRTDVYSLGVVLYELLTGEVPIKGENTREFFDNVVNAPPTPIAELEPEAPPELISICMRALSKDANMRYPSAEEFAVEIERFQSGALVQAYTYKTSDIIRRFVRRNLVTVSVSAGSFLLVAILTVYFILSIDNERTIAQAAFAQASLELAQNAIKEDRPRDAGEALLSIPQQYRAWEWGHLLYLASANLMAFPNENRDRANGRFSPDGSRIALVATNGTVRLLDSETGHQLLNIERNDKNMGGFAFMHDGQHFLTHGLDATVWMWDLETGLEVRSVAQLPMGRGSRRNFPSPDGHTVVTTWDRQIFVWDFETGKLRLTLDHTDHEREPINAVGWSHDSTTFATASWVTNFWDAETGEKVRTLPHHNNVTMALIFLNDGLLATTGRDGSIRIWDIATETLLHELKGHKIGWGGKIAYSASANLLFSAGSDRVVQMWDPVAGRFLRTLTTTPSMVQLISSNLDGSRVLIGGNGFAAEVLAVADMQSWRVWPGHTDDVMDLTFSPDGLQLASVSGDWPAPQDKRILLWDVASGEQVNSFSAGDEKIWGVEFSADGRSLFDCGSEGQVRQWNVRTGELLQTLNAGMEHVRDLAESPDGRYLAATGFDLPSFVLWDVESGAKLLELDDGPVDDVAFSPTGKLVAYTFRNGIGVRVVNVSQGAVEENVGTGICWSAEFSPNGSQLATAGDTATIQLWDVETWGLAQEFIGHNGRIRSLAFTPDGERLASRGDDDTIRIWDVHSGREVLTLAASPVRDATVAFSPDGRTLATGTTDGSVKLWPTFPWREEDYPGSPSLPVSERVELYKREFWREKSSLLKTYTSGATSLPNDPGLPNDQSIRK